MKFKFKYQNSVVSMEHTESVLMVITREREYDSTVLCWRSVALSNTVFPNLTLIKSRNSNAKKYR